MSNANEQIDKEIAALAALDDTDIDTTEIPEVTDWSRAAIGKFYDPGRSRVMVLVDDAATSLSSDALDDDRAVQTAVASQRSAKMFWSFGSLLVQWRAVALAGLACLLFAISILTVHSGWIPRHGGQAKEGTAGSNGGIKTTDRGDAAAFPEIAALSSDEQFAVQRALSSGNISTPSSLSDLRENLGSLRHESPDKKAFRVLEPVGEVVIDPRPLFRWQPLGEAVSYSVVIFDTKGNQVRTSSATRSTSWKPSHALQPGQVYQWQVKAVMGDGKSVVAPSFPKPEAKFRVLDQAKADELTRFRQAHPDSHLVLGILFAEAGLLKHAEGELREIQESDRNFELAQNLLRSVRELR